MLIDNGTVLYTCTWHKPRISCFQETQVKEDAVACYKEASRRSHVVKASFAVLTATYALLGRPPKSLAEGTSYLRIVFASTDYCLTCSVAFSCFASTLCSSYSVASLLPFAPCIHTYTYTYTYVWGMYSFKHIRMHCPFVTHL